MDYKHSKITGPHQSTKASSRPIQRHHPPPNILKLNIDHSTKQNSMCRITLIIRNNTGFPTFLHSEQSPFESPPQTEVNALLKGLCMALDSGSRRIVTESVNLAIINAINESCLTPWTITYNTGRD